MAIKWLCLSNKFNEVTKLHEDFTSCGTVFVNTRLGRWRLAKAPLDTPARWGEPVTSHRDIIPAEFAR